MTTAAEVRAWRTGVDERLTKAIKAGEAGVGDPISHHLDEYRACLTELDAWITELETAEADEHRAGRGGA